MHDVVDARITPNGHLDILAEVEVSKLLDTSQGGIYETFRNCSLAVLNCGNHLDDGKELLERYRAFDIRVIQQARGLKLEVKNAPASAFVDGKMIKGISEHLFAVLRDVVYASNEIMDSPNFDLKTEAGVTNSVCNYSGASFSKKNKKALDTVFVKKCEEITTCNPLGKSAHRHPLAPR